MAPRLDTGALTSTPCAPGWVGSLNRLTGRGHVWVADVHDGGARVDTVVDGYDTAVNAAA